MMPTPLLRNVIFGAACLVSASGYAADAQAVYPDHSVRLLVAYTAGGAADILTRALAQRLTLQWKQPVVVENRPGADGRIAMEYLAKNGGDGYTLMFGPNALYSIYPYVHPGSTVFAQRDLEPLAMVAISPLVLAVSAELPVHTLPELISYAKAHPTALSFGSPGNSSLHHMAGEAFDAYANVKMTHIPYKGTSQASTDLAGGRLQVLYGAMTGLAPLVAAKKARILAITADKRFDDMAGIPSIGETLKGWPDYSTFEGVFAAKGVPPEVRKKITDSVIQAVRDPEFEKALKQNGFAPDPGGPGQFRAKLERNYQEVGKVVKEIGMQPEN
jgi:tripartite-type tricarboxylate transporter receptor subunit TctC